MVTFAKNNYPLKTILKKYFSFAFKQLKTNNAKGVLSLFAGNTISKLLLTLGGFFLAKYYGADNYGVYNAFVGYVIILTALTSLKLENIIVLLKQKERVYQFFSDLLALVLPLSLIVFTFILLGKGLGLFSKLPTFLWVICGGTTLFYSWNNIHTFFFTKEKAFSHISKSIMIGSGITVAIQALFYFLGLKNYGLIYGFIIGSLITTIFHLSKSYKFIQKPKWTSFKEANTQHKKILQISFPSGFVNSVANNVLPILILDLYTAEQAGVFAISNKILTTPLILLSASFSNVYFQKATELYHQKKEDLWNLTKRISFINTAIILVFLIFINTFGIYLIELFFNKGWDNLGSYVLILSFWVLAKSLVNPISHIMLITEKNHYALIFNIYLLAVICFSMLFSNQLGSLLNTLIFVSLLFGIGYLILFYKIYKVLKSYS